MIFMKSPLLIAFLSGIAFVALASFKNVGSWPLLFPFAAGIAVMTINKKAVFKKNYRSMLLYGFYAALLVTIASMLSLWFIAREILEEKVADIGYKFSGFSLLVIVSISLALLFFLTYLLGTAIGAIFRYRNK